MEQLKHECGVAMVRLLKPLEYYHNKYGSWMYGLNKLYLLMEKQHNETGFLPALHLALPLGTIPKSFIPCCSPCFCLGC